MKRFFAIILLAFMMFAFSACKDFSKNAQTTSAVLTKAKQTTKAKEEERQKARMKINIRISEKIFTATLEDNAAAKELYEIIKNGGLTVEMSDYSGFEKVGALGKKLKSSDKQTTTKSGDIVLYQSNQIVMFYGSNSWSYTRLGRIDDLSGWEEALGSGDITADFSVD